jgi:multidrug efflux pump subunit AcrA (membrane-fusion protein)
MANVSKGDDYIDSRDVITLVDELTNDREICKDSVDGAQEALGEAQTAYDEAKEALDLLSFNDDREEAQKAYDEAQSALEVAQTDYDNAKADLEEWDDSEDAEQLKDLTELCELCENEGDWSYGVTLVHESAFEDHAKQEAEDCGLLENCNKWPANCIDWEQAADELKADYTVIEWGDETYYMRAC